MTRIKSLDGLRGLAAIGVAIFHAYPTYSFWMWTLVDLFFVLSGFLICTILLDHEVSFRNFLIRRVLRIWPVYYLTLTVAVALSYFRFWVGPSEPEPTGVVASYLFLQFIDLYGLSTKQAIEAVHGYMPWFGHGWSVAVEEQFYLLLPIFLILSGRRLKAIVVATAVSIGLGLYLRSSATYFALLGSRIDGLMLGVLLAAITRAIEERRLPWFTPDVSRMFLICSGAAGAALALPYVLGGYSAVALGESIEKYVLETGYTYALLGFALFYFSFIAWLVWERGSEISRLLGSAFPVYLGSISFAVYMFHIPVQCLVGLTDHGAPISDLPVAVQIGMWTLTLGSAHLSRQIIERRFSRLKERFPLNRKAGESIPEPATQLEAARAAE